jgi:hypothetical protein
MTTENITTDPEWARLLNQVQTAISDYEQCIAEGREWTDPFAQTKSEKKPAAGKTKQSSRFDQSELLAMTKEQLELLGRDHGIELDRRRRKQDLVDQLMDAK